MSFGVPLEGRGRRECRALNRTRNPRGQKGKCPQVVRQGRNRTALPAQWLYGLLRALPGVPLSYSHISRGVVAASKNASLFNDGGHQLDLWRSTSRVI